MEEALTLDFKNYIQFLLKVEQSVEDEKSMKLFSVKSELNYIEEEEYSSQPKKTSSKGLAQSSSFINDSDRERLVVSKSKTSQAMYFNCNIIHFGLSLHLHESQLSSDPTITILSSQFHTKLAVESEKGNYGSAYQDVINWNLHVDFFRTKVLLIPLNGAGHWTLGAVVNLDSLVTNNVSSLVTTSPKSCKFFLLDSLKPFHNAAVIGNQIKHYLLQVWLDSRNPRKYLVDESDMRVAIGLMEVSFLPVARQANDYDCGTHVCVSTKTICEAYKNSRNSAAAFDIGTLDFQITPAHVHAQRQYLIQQIDRIKAENREVVDLT